MATKKVKMWEKDSRSIFEKFAAQLCDYTKGEAIPKHGDLDLQYCLELQRKRQKEKNLSMRYEVIPRGHFPDHCPNGRSWSDNHYRCDMEWRTCRLEREFYHGDDRVWRDKKNMIFYQNITNTLGGDRVENDLYTCPSCGAISTLGTLEKGCPYCGSFFKMSELFPKITNFYFVEETGGTEEEVKKDILKTVIPTMIVFGLYVFFSTLLKTENVNMITLLFTTVIGSIIGGGIIGYMLWAVIKLMKMFWETAKALPLLFNSLGSRPAFERLMKKNSPEFSWEYFSDKVVSLLKMILYAEDATQLPSYIGDPMDNLFENVVDSYYTGAMGLKHFKVEGDWCYVTAGVYMDNLYDIGGRIRQKRDKFLVYLCRNIHTPMDAHFSIKCIRCKNCGSSFDATKQRNCPACGTRYEIGDDDWIVLRIEKA